MRRVGIFAGSFDPIHQGHIAFALAAASVYGLPKIWFLAEDQPPSKTLPTSLKHRLLMLSLGLKPYPNLSLLKLNDRRFTVAKTLPKIKKRFPGTKLYLLVGSDVYKTVKKWPGSDKLLKSMELICGQRQTVKRAGVKDQTHNIYTNFGDLSSSRIRDKLFKGQNHHGLSPEVLAYIQKHNLYDSAVSVSEA